MQIGKTCAAAALAGALNALLQQDTCKVLVTEAEVLAAFVHMWQKHIEAKRVSLLSALEEADKDTATHQLVTSALLGTGGDLSRLEGVPAPDGLADDVRYIVQLGGSLAKVSQSESEDKEMARASPSDIHSPTPRQLRAPTPSTAPVGNRQVVFALKALCPDVEGMVLICQATWAQQDEEAWWRTLWAAFHEKQAVLIYHMPRHYALVFGVREWTHATTGRRHRQVLTAKRKQQPQLWLEWDEDVVPALESHARVGILKLWKGHLPPPPSPPQK